MGRLVAEDFAEPGAGSLPKLCGEADHTAVKMDASERPPKAPAPFRAHGLLEAGQAPPAAPVPQESL